MNDRTAAILSAAGKIDHMYADWQENGGISPDDGDCVRICAQELGIPWPIKRMGVLEGGSQAEYDRQTIIANDLYERQCGDAESQLVNGLEIACWIIDRLAPKPYANGVTLGGPHS